jgi:hypothetical protein
MALPSTTSDTTTPFPNPASLLVDQVAAAPTAPGSYEERAFYEKHRLEIANSSQNMEERKRYAEGIFGFTCVWCLFLAIVLIGIGTEDLRLSDQVLITLITSTTVNVFVFFTYVTKYLFNESKST